MSTSPLTPPADVTDYARPAMRAKTNFDLVAAFTDAMMASPVFFTADAIVRRRTGEAAVGIVVCRAGGCAWTISADTARCAYSRMSRRISDLPINPTNIDFWRANTLLSHAIRDAEMAAIEANLDAAMGAAS